MSGFSYEVLSDIQSVYSRSTPGEPGEKPAAVERKERCHCLNVKIAGHVFSWKTFHSVLHSVVHRNNKNGFIKT